MEFNIKRIGINGLFVQASGRLDLDTAVDYGTKIKDTIEDSEETITEVVLDFSEITFISSIGLKVVLEIYNEIAEKGGELKVSGASEEVKKSFLMVGFDKFIVFE